MYYDDATKTMREASEPTESTLLSRSRVEQFEIEKLAKEKEKRDREAAIARQVERNKIANLERDNQPVINNASPPSTLGGLVTNYNNNNNNQTNPQIGSTNDSSTWRGDQQDFSIGGANSVYAAAVNSNRNKDKVIGGPFSTSQDSTSGGYEGNTRDLVNRTINNTPVSNKIASDVVEWDKPSSSLSPKKDIEVLYTRPNSAVPNTNAIEEEINGRTFSDPSSGFGTHPSIGSKGVGPQDMSGYSLQNMQDLMKENASKPVTPEEESKQFEEFTKSITPKEQSKLKDTAAAATAIKNDDTIPTEQKENVFQSYIDEYLSEDDELLSESFRAGLFGFGMSLLLNPDNMGSALVQGFKGYVDTESVLSRRRDVADVIKKAGEEGYAITPQQFAKLEAFTKSGDVADFPDIKKDSPKLNSTFKEGNNLMGLYTKPDGTTEVELIHELTPDEVTYEVENGYLVGTNKTTGVKTAIHPVKASTDMTGISHQNRVYKTAPSYDKGERESAYTSENTLGSVARIAENTKGFNGISPLDYYIMDNTGSFGSLFASPEGSAWYKEQMPVMLNVLNQRFGGAPSDKEYDRVKNLMLQDPWRGMYEYYKVLTPIVHQAFREHPDFYKVYEPGAREVFNEIEKSWDIMIPLGNNTFKLQKKGPDGKVINDIINMTNVNNAFIQQGVQLQ